MGNDELTVAILREIRDEVKSTKVELSSRLDATNERLDRVVQEQIRHSTAIVALEPCVGDLAEGQRAIVSELVKLNGRVDNILTGPLGETARATTSRVDALEGRVSALEKRVG